MKIRTDFVTNSSSSSFIIAYRKVPEETKTTPKDYLSNYQELIKKLVVDEDYETTKGIVIKNIKDIEKYILDYFGYNEDTLEDIIKEDEYAKDIYNMMCNYLLKGYVLMSKSVSYGNDYCYNLIDELTDNDNFIILEND